MWQKKQISEDNLDDKHVSKVFASLMMKGKVRSAMRWLLERSSGDELDPMQEVKKDLFRDFKASRPTQVTSLFAIASASFTRLWRCYNQFCFH